MLIQIYTGLTTGLSTEVSLGLIANTMFGKENTLAYYDTSNDEETG
jgi:hypothetical protein